MIFVNSHFDFFTPEKGGPKPRKGLEIWHPTEKGTKKEPIPGFG